ncbi:MAG: SLATT domain-containing protein [Chitinophagaceae bacterium]|jgi:hypothetical protein|nr:SLATT domain-containing protein [Chitinophagaceae bacterium]
MTTLNDKIKKVKVDCLYGKKKHFNAADRVESYHYWLGIPLTIINIVTGTVLFFIFTDNTESSLKLLPIILAFIAALLSGFQTYFNFNKKVEGHRRIGNRYLSVYKSCDRLQAYISDNQIEKSETIERLENIAKEIDDINKEAEQFPTSKKDYELAQLGIKNGEENYTKDELEL